MEPKRINGPGSAVEIECFEVWWHPLKGDGHIIKVPHGDGEFPGPEKRPRREDGFFCQGYYTPDSRDDLSSTRRAALRCLDLLREEEGDPRLPTLV